MAITSTSKALVNPSFDGGPKETVFISKSFGSFPATLELYSNTGTTNVDAAGSNIYGTAIYYCGAGSTSGAVNLVGNYQASVSLNSMLPVGGMATFVLMTSGGRVGISSVTVDGNPPAKTYYLNGVGGTQFGAQTYSWSTPTQGATVYPVTGDTGYYWNVYTITAMKTAAATFSVFVSLTNYA
jgi:hypothetical protein